MVAILDDVVDLQISRLKTHITACEQATVIEMWLIWQIILQLIVTTHNQTNLDTRSLWHIPLLIGNIRRSKLPAVCVVIPAVYASVLSLASSYSTWEAINPYRKRSANCTRMCWYRQCLLFLPLLRSCQRKTLTNWRQQCSSGKRSVFWIKAFTRQWIILKRTISCWEICSCRSYSSWSKIFNIH